jgi:hypothetical protein
MEQRAESRRIAEMFPLAWNSSQDSEKANPVASDVVPANSAPMTDFYPLVQIPVPRLSKPSNLMKSRISKVKKIRSTLRKQKMGTFVLYTVVKDKCIPSVRKCSGGVLKARNIFKSNLPSIFGALAPRQ